MSYINFNAASDYITRDSVAFLCPVCASTFLIRFAKGESCTFAGTVVALSCLLANDRVRSQIESLSAGCGRFAALADLDSFIFFEL